MSEIVQIRLNLAGAVQLFQSEFVDGIGILQELFMNSSTRLSTRIPIGKAIVNIFTDTYVHIVFFSDCTIGTYGVHKLPVISNFQQNPTVTVLMIMPEDLSVSILLESQIPCFENSSSEAKIWQNPTRIQDFR